MTHEIRSPVLDAGPLFICGGDRTGLGLLCELFEQHPDFSLSRRTNFFSSYRGRFGDVRQRENRERLLAAMQADRRYAMFAIDSEIVRHRVERDARSDDDLYRILQESRAERIGRSRWGDKSLWSERHATKILTVYPTARMVQVVRDPRDQFASFKHHRRRGDLDVAVGAAMIRRSMRLAERNRLRHPDRYSVVRYEDLVREPERVSEDVCRFLDAVFTPDMLLEPSDSGVAIPRTMHTRSIGRYRRDLSGGEIAVVEFATAASMRVFGYHADTPVPARIISSAPSLVRMLAWAAFSRIRESLRGVLRRHRTPDSRPV